MVHYASQHTGAAATLGLCASIDQSLVSSVMADIKWLTWCSVPLALSAGVKIDHAILHTLKSRPPSDGLRFDRHGQMCNHLWRCRYAMAADAAISARGSHHVSKSRKRLYISSSHTPTTCFHLHEMTMPYTSCLLYAS